MLGSLTNISFIARKRAFELGPHQTWQTARVREIPKKIVVLRPLYMFSHKPLNRQVNESDINLSNEQK